jgi:hypothetical protein
MNDVLIIALLYVIEDKKWRNIFYPEDIPPDWNLGTERERLDDPMIIIYARHAGQQDRFDRIFITRCINPEYSRITSFTGGISHCNHIGPTSRIILTMLIFDSLNA